MAGSRRHHRQPAFGVGQHQVIFVIFDARDQLQAPLQCLSGFVELIDRNEVEAENEGDPGRRPPIADAGEGGDRGTLVVERLRGISGELDGAPEPALSKRLSPVVSQLSEHPDTRLEQLVGIGVAPGGVDVSEEVGGKCDIHLAPHPGERVVRLLHQRCHFLEPPPDERDAARLVHRSGP